MSVDLMSVRLMKGLQGGARGVSAAHGPPTSTRFGAAR